MVKHALARALAVVIVGTLPLVSVADEVRRALVIGNNAYSIQPLVNSVNDAKSMTRALEKLGFKTTTLLDVPASKISEAAAKFLNNGADKPGTVSILFYSGHGLQFRDRNWMLGIDVSPKGFDKGGMADLQELLAKIKPTSDAVNIVVLDSCRDYAPESASNKPFAPLDAPPGTLLAFSTAPGRYAADGGVGDTNGIYTKFLLKYINSPGLPIESIFKKVRVEVMRETQGEQIPWENSSLMRDFYFNPAQPGYSDSLEKAKPSAGVETLPTKPTKSAAVKSSGKLVVIEKPLPDLTNLPQIVAPTDNLTMLYRALSQMRAGPDGTARLAKSVSEDPYSNTNISGTPAERANQVLKKLTELEFSDAELLAMSKDILTVHAAMIPIQPWAESMLGLNGESGLLLSSVVQGGIADRMGAHEGDILLRVNGKPVRSIDDITTIADTLRPGEAVYATLIRGKERIDVNGAVERSSVDHLVYIASSVAMIEKNHERAKQLINFLARRGHGESNALLANWAFNEAMGGGGVLGFLSSKPEKYAEAISYATIASLAGVSKGDYWLTIANLKGAGVPQDLRKANELREKWASRGSAWALAGLGTAYMQGQGVTKDYIRAKGYLERAAAQGYFDGMLGLAMLFENGWGVARDPSTAITWYERAIATGNLSAKKTAEPRISKLRQQM